MLISEDYRAQNNELHQNPAYGAANATGRFANDIAALMISVQAKTAIDYGCGKGNMRKLLMGTPNAHLLPILTLYDPAIPAFAEHPTIPADFVYCTDVLEHIEPPCLKAVLDDLKHLTGKVGFFTVATRPAQKHLPDGRNAHLSQHPARWWLGEMLKRFEISQFIDLGGECVFIVGAKS